jgi:hypothetical protein
MYIASKGGSKALSPRQRAKYEEALALSNQMKEWQLRTVKREESFG